MTEFNSIQTLYNNVKSELDSVTDNNSASIIFSFNGAGKTRLSNEFRNLNDAEENLKVLCYNAFFEDYFFWDNEEYILNLNPSWVRDLIKSQELETQIIKNFNNILNTKIEPSFDKDMSKISFNIPTGDETAQENIKISRGEESTFVWIVFYTILESAIDSLNTKEENRPTDFFNHLEYIIIDDPVSSLDDTRLITLAVNLIGLIKEYKKKNLKFLITTHHALFYNIFYCSFKFENFKRNTKILSKDNLKFKLDKMKDSPFSYHHDVILKIQKAVNSDSIEKYNFNLFRALLEKTSSFLGLGNFENCIIGEKKEEIVRLLHSYSHNKLIETEFKELPDEHKKLFKLAFNNFIKEFRWKVSE
jgi:hypothetical protein